MALWTIWWVAHFLLFSKTGASVKFFELINVHTWLEQICWMGLYLVNLCFKSISFCFHVLSYLTKYFYFHGLSKVLLNHVTRLCCFYSSCFIALFRKDVRAVLYQSSLLFPMIALNICPQCVHAFWLNIVNVVIVLSSYTICVT